MHVLSWLIQRLSSLTVILYKLQRVPVWRSADGRVRLISKLDDQHLFNAIGVLQRQPDCKQSNVYPYMMAELEKRKSQGVVFHKNMRKKRDSFGVLDWRYSGHPDGK